MSYSHLTSDQEIQLLKQRILDLEAKHFQTSLDEVIAFANQEVSDSALLTGEAKTAREMIERSIAALATLLREKEEHQKKALQPEISG